MERGNKMADDRIRWDEKPVRLGKKGFVTWKTAMNELNQRVGLLKNLKPSVEDKSNIVNAINEISERVGVLSELQTGVKTSIVNAINDLHGWLISVNNWVGLRNEVQVKYITTHGNTLSKLVNYLLGRDETVATAASVEEVAAQASAAATKAESAEGLATSANTTATTASEWLGKKSDFTNMPPLPNPNLTKLVKDLFGMHPIGQKSAFLTKTVTTTIPSLPAHSWCSANIVYPAVTDYKVLAKISRLTEYVPQTSPVAIETAVCDSDGNVYNFTDTTLTNVEIETIVIYANFGHFAAIG